MSLFTIILAVFPLALYCLILGILHLRKRPHVISGGRDLACLGMAMSGLFVVGPAEIFFPQSWFNLIGASLWILLISLYVLLILLAILNAKPRLIVYGMDVESLVGRLDEVLQHLDPSSKWIGHSFVAPGLGIQAVVEPAGPSVVSHILASTRAQNFGGWHALENGLRENLRSVEIPRRPIGQFWIGIGLTILILISYSFISQSVAISQGIREMLRN